MKTLIENITVIFHDGSYEENIYVAYDKGRFTYVGKGAPTGDFQRKINGSGKIMIPGLYNCHAHSPMTHFRGMAEDLPLDRWLNEAIFPAEDKLNGSLAYTGALLSCAEMIASGTVSMSEMYFFCPQIAEAIGKAGMKANISRCVVSFDENAEMKNDVRVLEALELFNSYNNAFDGRIKVDMSLHAEYTNTENSCRYVADLAKRLGCGIQVHLSETQKEHIEAKHRHGMTACELFEKTGVFDSVTNAAHCVWVEDGDIDIMAKRGVTVSHNPISNLKLGSGVAPLEKMINKGINVTLGTDGAASNNRLSILNELNAASLIHRGVTGNTEFPGASILLPMATANGARSQMRDDCGMIKAGCKADFALIDVTKCHNIPSYSPVNTLLYTVYPTDVCLTVCDGVTLYENGDFKTIDIEKLKYEMNNSRSHFTEG